MPHGRLGLVFHHVRGLFGDRSAHELTDRVLLERFAQTRDETAFETLVERHGPMVLGICRRVLGDAHAADDAFQATFLVLARKAGAPGWHDSIGNWLYGVALRTARKAKARALRCQGQGQEKQAASLSSTDSEADRLLLPCPADADPLSEAVRREFGRLLDEELTRLPGKYRAPLVLCYLEGKTAAEAAQALGQPTGSMSRHLARGRELLRERLVSRGVALSGASCMVLLMHSAAPAVPGRLVISTVQVARNGLAGSTLAGTISSEISTLAKGVLRTMLLQKIKWTTVVLLALVGIGWGGSALWRGTATAEPLPVPAIRAAAPSEAPDKKADAPVAMPQGSLARAARGKLRERVDFIGFDPGTSLKEALAYISDKYEVPIVLDTAAFTAAGIDKVQDVPVTLPKMNGIRLGTILRMVLKQVKGDGSATGGYLIRPDGIEVTTSQAIAVEVLGAEKAPTDLFGGQPEAENALIDRTVPLESLVSIDFDKKPLVEALSELAELQGINIIIDPRVGEKAKTTLTLSVNNVLCDSLLRTLADMADLRAVPVNNMTYITTKANADAIEAEVTKRRAKTMPMATGSETKK